MKWITRHWRVALPLVSALVMLALSILRTAGTRDLPGPFDDTYIVFVYANHVLHHGVAYFSDPSLRVEGFTSTLDLVVKMALVPFFDVSLIRACVVVSTILCAAVMTRLWAHVRPLLLEKETAPAAWLGLLWIACDPLFARCGLNTLETALYLATGVTFLLAFTQATRPVALGGLAALWAASRPEAVGAVIGLSLARLLVVRRRDPRDLGAVLGAAGVLLLRRLYFGFWAPNTYYAKRSDILAYELRDGVGYVLGTAQKNPLQAIVVASMFVVVPILLYREARSRTFSLPLTLGGTSLYGIVATIYGGGDGYETLGRFLVLSSLTASLCLWLLLLEARARTNLQRVFLAVAAIIGVINVATSDPIHGVTTYAQELRNIEQLHRCDAEIAEKLGEAFPGARISSTDFEKLKFHNDALKVDDLSGLNDVAIAHGPATWPVTWGKGSWDTALARGHDIVFWNYMFRSAAHVGDSASSDRTPARLLALFGWPAEGLPDARIWDTYRPASILACGGSYNFVVRKTLQPAKPGIVLLSADDRD